MYQRIRLLFLAVGLYEFVMSIIDTYNFWNGAKEALMAGKGLADLEGSHFYLSGLAILYLMAICMFTMVVRFTIKIRRVKQEKIFS